MSSQCGGDSLSGISHSARIATPPFLVPFWWPRFDPRIQRIAILMDMSGLEEEFNLLCSEVLDDLSLPHHLVAYRTDKLP